ncbi:OmpA family protein [Psychrobacter piscatorii]|uniref:OmpA family protein n=1 Tax=Psychrobacter piscatorii TaxID=554343 RepID=UPI00191B126D|nr:OmpA family protein [Psychrobacter piscatorii]
MITKPYNALLFAAALTLAGCQTATTIPPQYENIRTMQADSDLDGDGVLDAIDECPETLSYSVVDAKGCTVVIGGDALEMSFAGFFPHMSSQLSNSYTLEFGKIEEKLSEYPEATVFIFGHTASSERDEAAVTHFGSDMLARNRALIVKNMLVLDHGIAAERIHTYDCSNKILATDNDFSDRNVNNIEAKQSRITLMASSEVHDLNNFKYISYEQLYEKYAQQCKPFA